MFGNLPKYFNNIKNTPDEKLDALLEKLKNEIYNDIKISIKKLNIESEVVYGLLLVMYNINKEIDKTKLKSLFQYIFLKFIKIVPINKNGQYFINYWESNETSFILNYSFPVLSSVFNLILKEYKKKEYKQRLIDCNEAEEGYILEHLIYLSFDSEEEPFNEKLKIHKSYEIDQVFHFSKFYINNNEKKIFLNSKREDYINSLFQEGKNYHLFQHNESGPFFDGALLLSDKKIYIDNDDKLNKTNEINLNEEKNNDNEGKNQANNNKQKKKKYNLIIYQSTKKKTKNRIDNNFVNQNKDMIIKNLELLLNIRIKKFNFIYILEYEKQDQSLIRFCESIENQIEYFFYSIEKNKFVNRNGEEIHIKNFISEIRVTKNVIQYINKNKERNENFFKQIISGLPVEYDIEKGNIFLTRKTKRNEENINYKTEDNFLCFYDSDESIIIPKDIKLKKTAYEEKMKKKKKIFFLKMNIQEIMEVVIIMHLLSYLMLRSN